jgi:hypothetical protein
MPSAVFAYRVSYVTESLPNRCEAPPGYPRNATLGSISFQSCSCCRAHTIDPTEVGPSVQSELAAGSRDIPEHWPSRGQLGSYIESEHDLVRFFAAPMSEPAPLAHDKETALRQHTNRRGVVARSASVKRTGCLQLQELL